MPIPGDYLDREWVELAGANPQLVEQYRSVLVAFAASGKDLQLDLVGTGFCIGAGEGMGVFLTAKHVIQKGVVDVQKPHRIHASSALEQFLPPSATMPKVGGTNLCAVWADQLHAQAMEVVSANYNDTTDLACCLLMRYAPISTPFSPPCVPLSTEIPKVGDVVHLVSYDRMHRTLLSQERETGPPYSYFRALSIRMGYVTGVYLDGYRQYNWPCFTTSIPAEPGMSGGFVQLPKDGEPISACGVVCADNSSSVARGDQMIAGESVIGLGYMALGLSVPSETRNDARHITLQEMMRRGDLPPAVGGFEQFNIFVDGAEL